MKRFALLFALALAGGASARPLTGDVTDASGKPLRSSCALARLDARDPAASVLDCVISDARATRPLGQTDSATVLLAADAAPRSGLRIVAGATRSAAPAPTNLALRVLITDPPKAAQDDGREVWLVPTRRR